MPGWSKWPSSGISKNSKYYVHHVGLTLLIYVSVFLTRLKTPWEQKSLSSLNSWQPRVKATIGIEAWSQPDPLPFSSYLQFPHSLWEYIQTLCKIPPPPSHSAVTPWLSFGPKSQHFQSGFQSMEDRPGRGYSISGRRVRSLGQGILGPK